jgi:UDP-3-O-[3-hydroxymyristoyl] glucosamine N-acyltransferase
MTGQGAGIRLDEIVARLGGELVGDGSVRVRRVATLEGADRDGISFLANPRYRKQLAHTAAAAVILAPGAADAFSGPRILTANPYLYFARVSQLLNPLPPGDGRVHPSAVIEAALPPDVTVGAGCYIGPEARIGAGSRIGAGCMLGRGVVLGAGCLLYPGVSIYDDCIVGARAIIHSGAVIGSDGFGFAREADGSWVKIPQVGRVVIGDDVEIGANTTIDRGAIDDTVIEDGVKLDNQIQIGHNVRIGAHTAIAGCVGIAGSTRIGRRCMIGGAADIIGHLNIGDDVIISAAAFVTKSISQPGVYSGAPAEPHREWLKNAAQLRHLEKMANKIWELEKRLAQLEKRT